MTSGPAPPDLSPHFLTVEELTDPIDWLRFFGQPGPVELDIGCGRGVFIATAAVANPDVNYLGLEIDFKEGRRAARKLHKRDLPNARIIGGDCRRVLGEFIAEGSVAAAHVYFPDPWWKKRHHKRRLFTDEFANLLARIVRVGGHVHSWTDVPDYFEVISRLMDHHPQFEKLPPPDERTPDHDMDYQTSFERKKRKAGLPIYRGLWQRSDVVRHN